MQRSSMIVLAGLLAVGVACVALWLRRGGEGEPLPGALSPGSGDEASASLEPPELLPVTPRESVAPDGPTESSTVAREEAAPAESSLANGTLHGKALVMEGEDWVPAPDVIAMLVSGHQEPSPAEVQRLLSEASPSHFQLSDELGRFTFYGLERGAPYALLLGRAGLLGAQRFWPVQADAGVRDFRLHHLYGAVLHLRDPNGGPPSVNPGLVGQRAGRALSSKPGVFPLFGTASAALLSGVTAEQLDPAVVADRLLLFTSAVAEEQVGPFQFRASFPGYEPIDTPFEARRASLGFSEYDVDIVPRAAGFGEIEIDVMGWRGPCPAFLSESGAKAFLRLNSTTGEVIHFEVRNPGENGLRIGGIPWGEYDATFGTSPSLRSTVRGGGPPNRVRVGAVPGRLRLDLSERGSLVLKLIDAQGELHEGRVSLLLSKSAQAASGWRTYHIAEPPYRIDDLEPGVWNLYMQIPFQAGTSALMPQPVRVAGGTCTEVELVDR